MEVEADADTAAGGDILRLCIHKFMVRSYWRSGLKGQKVDVIPIWSGKPTIDRYNAVN